MFHFLSLRNVSTYRVYKLLLFLLVRINLSQLDVTNYLTLTSELMFRNKLEERSGITSFHSTKITDHIYI